MTMPVEYAAAKSGINQMTAYFAKYYKDKNIRFNCISPGGIFNKQPDKFVNNYSMHCGNLGLLSADDLNGIVEFPISQISVYIWTKYNC